MVYIILIVQTLIASGTHIVAKVVVEDIDPVTLTFLRSMIAAIGLLIIFLIREKRIRIERSDRFKMITLGALAIPLNQFAFLIAIGLTTPSNASLFYATTPVFVMIFSAILLHERSLLFAKIGVVIGFVGIAVVIFERGINFSSDYTLGNIIMIVAVCAWGLYTVLGRPLVLKYGSFHVSALSMIIGAVLFIPIGIVPALRFDYTTIGLAHLYGLLYLGIGTSIIAYFLWYYALGRIESTKVAVFTYLQPVVTTILAVIILEQRITLQFITGACIALFGVVLVQSSKTLNTVTDFVFHRKNAIRKRP
jgi:drug/metabolite transporter (DMT)-like permease